MTQPTTARLDLSVWRNDDVYEFPLRVAGVDLSDTALAMQVRLAPDTPGAPLIDLAKVTNGTAEGLRVAGVSLVDGVPVSDVRIRINKSTRQALPYTGELGDATPLAYALLIGGKTRLAGNLVVLAHAYGSDNAPASRPVGYGGSTPSSAPSGAATLTISADGGATLTIDGLEFIAPLVADAAQSRNLAALSSSAAARSEADSADNARDAEGALVGIRDALAGFPNGATLTAPIASRALLRNAAAYDGNTAFLTEAGRRGNFVFVAGDMSVLVAADPKEGVSVAPDNDRTGRSGAWVRTGVTNTVQAEWFGAVGDGSEQPDGTCRGTDNTAAIQAAADFTGAINGVEVRLGWGIFVVAAAPSGVAQAQISLPIVGDQSDQRVLRLRGAAPQSMTWATNRGTVIRSTWTIPGDTQVIGVKHPGRGGDAPEQHSHAVWMGFYMDDLCVRTAEGHPISHLDVSYLPFYRISNCRFDVPRLAVPVANGTARFTNAEPVTSTSYGIKGAKNDLPLRCLLDNVCFAGCYTGARLGELSGGDNLTFIANKRMIEVPNIRHGASFGYVLGCNNQGGIYVTADEPAKLLIGYYDLEHNDATQMGSGPDWVTPLGDDIYDPDFMLRGACRVHYHSNNFVTNLPFKINGESVEDDSTVYHPNFRLQFVELARNNEWPTPMLYPGFFLQDAAVHVVRRGIKTSDSRRVAWHALLTKQANMQNGLLGGYAFVNELIPDGEEKRMAASYAEMSGERSGAYYIGTTNEGVFAPRWGYTPKGDMRGLADDTKVLASGANNDRSGVVVLQGASSFTKRYARPYNSAPVVIVTPNVLPADAVVRTQSYADKFVIEIKKSDDTLYAVSGSLFYTTMGNPD